MVPQHQEKLILRQLREEERQVRSRLKISSANRGKIVATQNQLIPDQCASIVIRKVFNGNKFFCKFQAIYFRRPNRNLGCYGGHGGYLHQICIDQNLGFAFRRLDHFICASEIGIQKTCVSNEKWRQVPAKTVCIWWKIWRWKKWRPQKFHVC